MKRVLGLTFAIAAIAVPAKATDHIGVFPDQIGATSTCSMVPPAFASFSVYVVHQTAGTTGSQFRVINASGYSLSGSVLGGYLAIGDVFTDLSLAYGSCLPGPPVAVVQLSGFGFPVPGPACGTVQVAAAPNKPYPIAVDCYFAEIGATAGRFTFNETDTCACLVNATEESTWGKVKSLYR